MKRIPTKTPFASRSLQLIATVAILCAVAAVTTLKGAEDDRNGDRTKQVFYTTSDSGQANGAEIWAIEVSRGKITATDIGPTFGGDCVTLALSPLSGILYSMCGPLFGTQQLATIDPNSGRANLFGVGIPGLSVMALAFGPDGTLYAVGDCNLAGPECTSTGDPNYNSLYTVNTANGAFTRVGSTGAPQFFMDLAFDGNGHLFGVTTPFSSNFVPAILYRINPKTGVAKQIAILVGNNQVMGLAFGRDGRLYGTDVTEFSGLYLIDAKTGFETAIFRLPFCCSSNLELVNPNGSQ
jgi:hypothetical protein